MNFEYVLFDLDGTLTDPKDGITRSVAYALEKLDAASLDEQTLESFIGPPLLDSFCTICGFDQPKAEKAINFYRERFKQIGMYENRVYPGIESLLSLLKEKGKKLAVATSKPTVFADEIVSHFNLKQYFEVIVGSNLDGTRSVKNEVIREALKQLSLPPKQSVVMIGDRKYDIIGAQKEGISSIGVSYGYGSQEELELARPTKIVSDIQQLEEYLMK